MKSVRSILLIATALTSCASNTGTGIFAGGTLGAGVGGIAGGGDGAMLIGAAGIIAGGLLGAALDAQDRKVMEQSSPRTVERMDRGEPLTVSDVIKLSQGGVSDDSIIGYIRDTKSSYNLTRGHMRRLQDAGTSQRVIHYMINSGR